MKTSTLKISLSQVVYYVGQHFSAFNSFHCSEVTCHSALTEFCFSLLFQGLSQQAKTKKTVYFKCLDFNWWVIRTVKESCFVKK